MNSTELRSTYIDVVAFLDSLGGTYRSIDHATLRDIIDALVAGRFRIVRNSAGEIESFTSWWLVHKEDLALVQCGGRPDDIDHGAIVYVADHAGVGAYPDLIRFLKTISDKGCWHHRYKQPGNFRHYPKKDGWYE
jgi:hypothetical protein